MRYGKLLMYVAPLLAVAACGGDDGVGVQGGMEPTASVRFINAVPDTGTVDLRFVDRVENLPTLQGVAFRAASGFYQGVVAGARPARIFPNSTNPVVTQVFLIDQTINLAADTRYTLVYAGRASATAPAAERHRLAVIEDPRIPPTPPANQIAIQALHVAVGVGNVDVYVVPVATATAATPTDFATNNAGVLRNVPFLGKAAAYVNVPVRPAATVAGPGGTPPATAPLYRFVVTAAGSTTALFAATPNQPGAPSTFATAGPQPGVRISGSVLTAVVASGQTAGTRESVAANQTPTVFIIADKVLDP